MIWDGVNIELYEITVARGMRVMKGEITVPLLSTIPSDCRRAFLTDQFVLTHHPAQINICNFQGNVKQTLDFPESEGYIEHLTLF